MPIVLFLYILTSNSLGKYGNSNKSKMDSFIKTSLKLPVLIISFISFLNLCLKSFPFVISNIAEEISVDDLINERRSSSSSIFASTPKYPFHLFYHKQLCLMNL